MKTIAICGSTCVGKTTLINNLLPYYSNSFVVQEQAQNNPFFFNDKNGEENCVFKSQLMFYAEYLKNISECLKNQYEIIFFDRYIDEYFLISKFRYSIGELSGSEFFICSNFAENIKFFSPRINKIIYLHCSLETAIERKYNRARRWDLNVNVNHLQELMSAYDKWYEEISNNENIKTMSVNTDNEIDLNNIIEFIG